MNAPPAARPPIPPARPPFPLIRHLSALATPWLLRLPVTPNQVTAASLVLGLAAAWGMAGAHLAIVGGALALVVSYVLDNSDGEVARRKNLCSEFGRQFDTFADWAVHTALFAALGLGTAARTGDALWLWLGWAAAAGGTINYGLKLWLEVRERRVGVAGGMGPELAAEPGADGTWPDGFIDRLVFAFRELARADFCFIVLVLALFDAAWLLLAPAAVGAQIYWLLQFRRAARRFRV